MLHMKLVNNSGKFLLYLSYGAGNDEKLGQVSP